MEIQLQIAQDRFALGAERLKSRVRQALQLLEQDHIELSILLTGDEKIRELNYNYREKDEATDVLAFPQDPDAIGENGRKLLGDVAVSVDTASRQAQSHGLRLEEEIVLLIIHGVLHLMGCDHERSPAEAQYMKRTTRSVFEEIFPEAAPSAGDFL